jgi:acyl-CoA reductase-like NAD-dependent aldehyde dehydrogenase
MVQKYKVLIDGIWKDSTTGDVINVVNPANGETIGQAPKCGEIEVNEAVEAAAKAAPGWASLPMSERSKIIMTASRLIMENQEELAKLETMEQGSPIRKTMNFDVPLCAQQLEYFAGTARALKGETLPVGPWCLSATVREPLGVVGLITPWNFPALMVIWKLGAALVTGNACIVKPPSTAPLTTIKLGEIFMKAGVPAGVVNVITGPGDVVGEALVKHPKVAKIGFTGDTATGKRIMKLASDTVKQVGLELGGKNAFVVLEDADVESAVEGAIFGAFFNSGQVCAAASRFYIHESLYDQFATKFVAAARKLKYGDTMNMETVLGPVAYKAHRDSIENYIADGKREGAKLLLGGERPNTPETKNGYYVAPTVFGECHNNLKIMREEIFGPVVGLARFKTVDEAIKLVNDSRFGLSASVWTKNTRLGLSMANQIKAGTVWINEHLIIFCETPWGGCKESGWGKDLSTMVFDEYTKVKHIYIDLNEQPVKPWYHILK